MGALSDAERAHPHTQEPYPPIERHALQTFASRAPDRARVLRRRGDGLVAGHRLEVVVAKLEPYRPAHITLALQVVGDADAKLGEDARQRFAIARRMEIALECRLAADRFGLAECLHGPVVSSIRELVHPRARPLAEMLDQPGGIDVGQLADGTHAQRLEPGTRLGADTVDLARRQRPDAPRDIVGGKHGPAIGLIELRGDLGEKLVWRDRDRAREPGLRAHLFLDRLGDVARATTL